VLKTVYPKLAEDLATTISRCLVSGTLPLSIKESTTVTLRKDRKQDYSLPQSYRPIALENTLAKMVKKIVADHIAEAAETHNLLP
jgi:hypothetical protein